MMANSTSLNGSGLHVVWCRDLRLSSWVCHTLAILKLRCTACGGSCSSSSNLALNKVLTHRNIWEAHWHSFWHTSHPALRNLSMLRHADKAWLDITLLAQHSPAWRSNSLWETLRRRGTWT